MKLVFKKILVYTLVILSALFWTACNHLEWRGSAIPKLVWSKSDRISIKDIQSERSINSLNYQNKLLSSTPYWTQFRGPNSEGLYNQEILVDWPENGPKLIWKKLIGSGHSSFSIANGSLFTIEQQGEEEVVVAFSTNNGDLIWKYPYNAKFEEYFGGIGPRSTPTWSNDKIYSLGAEGDLKCLNSSTGKLLWELNSNETNNTEIPYWGVSYSPIVYKDLLILCPGGENDNAIMALNKDNGELIWSKHNGKQVYSTPIIFNFHDTDHLIIALEGKIISINPENGDLYWSHNWKITMNNNNISQPTKLSKDQMLISAGYGTGAEALAIIKDGDKYNTKTLWKSKRLKTKFSSPIYKNGFIYGLNENRLVCIDSIDGSLKWTGNKYGYGQIISASDHLLILGDSGDLSLVKMNPEKFIEKASYKALKGGRTWNYPALAGGLLFLRNSHEIVCYDLRPNKLNNKDTH